MSIYSTMKRVQVTCYNPISVWFLLSLLVSRFKVRRFDIRADNLPDFYRTLFIKSQELMPLQFLLDSEEFYNNLNEALGKKYSKNR